MRLWLDLALKGQKPYHYFMHTPGVTQCLHLSEGEKRRPGMCGRGIMMSLQSSWDCPPAQNVSHEVVAVLEVGTLHNPAL